MLALLAHLVMAQAWPPRCQANDRLIAAAVATVSDVYVVPADLVRAVIRQESDCDPAAVSRVGALGLMQVMPDTARKVSVDPKALTQPAANILAGSRLLAVLLKHYQGDLISVLIAYNNGPLVPMSHIPLNGETPDYVLRVLGFYRELAGLGLQMKHP